MTNINFYCLNEDMFIFFYTLLLKIYESNKKILIYSTNNDKNRELDLFLWSYKKTSFLPHLLLNDKNSNRTSIVITDELKNVNNADLLLTSEYIDDGVFLNSFDKVYYAFDEINIKTARVNWKKYKDKDYNLEYFEKKDGKWDKKA
ncbi:MAG: DNA polymerase III subunit chi [Rickettsiales bacterium]|jgi:DNA polymerase-3 subunit chi|nr:DNA polymerase III subunit chi [Rickettsiales bacterium]